MGSQAGVCSPLCPGSSKKTLCGGDKGRSSAAGLPGHLERGLSRGGPGAQPDAGGVCRELSSAFFYGGYQCIAGSTPSPLGAG